MTPPRACPHKLTNQNADEEEAGTVVHIFRRYVELRSVRVLQAELDVAGIRSKRRILADALPLVVRSFPAGPSI